MEIIQVCFFRYYQTKHESGRKVSSFLTVLGPLIMISQRQAAPSRYQHIISGLVQPLNHTRHKNPLVSVTFYPTQEARWQSAIWMLRSLFSHFPPHFFPPPPRKTFPYTALLLPFCICCIGYISICVWTAIPQYIISTFYQVRPSKIIFLLMPLSGTCKAYKAILQLDN